MCCAWSLPACGSDGATTTPTTAPASTSTTVAPEAEPDDVVLRLSDFRTGWTQLELTEAELQEAVVGAGEIYRCIEAEAPTTPPSAASMFQLTALTRVVSAADRMASEEEAQAVYAAITGQRAADCARRSFEQGLRAGGVPVASSTIELLSPQPVGDEASGYRVVATLEPRAGQQVPVYFDSLSIRKGRFLLGLGLLNAGAPFVEDVGADLAAKMAARA